MWATITKAIGLDGQGDSGDLSHEEEAEEESDLEQELFLEEEVIATEWRNGKVTRIEDDFYLIDDRYYWPADLSAKIVSRPGGRVRLEDDVRFKVIKRSENTDWKVDEVERVSKPFKEGEGNDIYVVVLMPSSHVVLCFR